MLNKIIGVTLDKALDADIVWTKTTTGYSASCDAEKKPLVITMDDLPPDARRDDHSLFTFVTSDGIDLRGLIEAWREARQTAWQTTVKVLTTGVLAALLVGIAIKLRLLGGPQ